MTLVPNRSVVGVFDCICVWNMGAKTFKFKIIGPIWLHRYIVYVYIQIHLDILSICIYICSSLTELQLKSQSIRQVKVVKDAETTRRLSVTVKLEVSQRKGNGSYHLSNEKIRDYTTQLCGDYFINHEIRIPIKHLGAPLSTLLGTNISHSKEVGKMSFLSHWRDMLVPWRVINSHPKIRHTGRGWWDKKLVQKVLAF